MAVASEAVLSISVSGAISVSGPSHARETPRRPRSGPRHPLLWAVSPVPARRCRCRNCGCRRVESDPADTPTSRREARARRVQVRVLLRNRRASILRRGVAGHLTGQAIAHATMVFKQRLLAPGSLISWRRRCICLAMAASVTTCPGHTAWVRSSRVRISSGRCRNTRSSSYSLLLMGISVPCRYRLRRRGRRRNSSK